VHAGSRDRRSGCTRRKEPASVLGFMEKRTGQVRRLQEEAEAEAGPPRGGGESGGPVSVKVKQQNIDEFNK
jgi:hypothetical protein